MFIVAIKIWWTISYENFGVFLILNNATTNRGNTKSVTDELLSQHMDTELNLPDQIRNLTDTMKKMNNSIESLRSEVKDINAELGQSVNFAHDNISDVQIKWKR